MSSEYPRPVKNWLAVLVALALSASGVFAQTKLLPESHPQRVFGGGAQSIRVALKNEADRTAEFAVRLRLLQTTSATTAQLSDVPWKQFQVLTGQTILESAMVNIPAVKAVTRFVIQWVTGSNQVFGVSEVLVYPTNLFARFKILAGAEPLGVFDPGNDLKPLLRAQEMEFQDLVEDGADKFHGRLAVFGPFTSRQPICDTLIDDIRALAKRGVAVVWLQPPPDSRTPLKPSFYTVRVGNGAVVVAQGELVSRLAEGPEAQLNLIRLAEAALHPEPLDLPESQNPN